MATTEQINQLKKQYPNFPWATASQDVINTFVASKLAAQTVAPAATSIPAFPESAAKVMIVNEFTRLKRSYTVAELNNYLTLARLDWKDLGANATFAGLTEKMRARINSLPPQEPAVVDNQQDYAPVIQSPSTPATTQPTTVTLPNVLNPSSPVTITLTPTGTQTPVTTQTAQTVTSISDVVDNALDYAPAIASTTDTSVSTDTTGTAAVTEAGMSSNTFAIILLIGAAIGVIFAMFKGVKK